MPLLRLLDEPDQAGKAAVLAILRATDPGATIAPDWRTGVIEVTGAAPAETLCVALRVAGFRVETLLQRPRQVVPADYLVLAFQVLGFSVIGAAAGILLGGLLGMMYVRLNPGCESVTDGGACTNSVFIGAMIVSGLGAIVAAGVTAMIGGMRLAHMRRTGEDVPFLRF